MMSKYADNNFTGEGPGDITRENSGHISGESSGESSGENSRENSGEVTSGTTSGATSVEDSGGSSGENSAFMSLYNFITNHLSSSQHIWCINKTRIAYNLEIEDLKPFLQFWIKHCDET